MIEQRAPDRPEPDALRLAGAEVDHGAWYLYGIVRAEPDAPLLMERERVGRCRPPDVEAGAVEPVVALECGELAAVARRVRRADFSPQALRERLADPAVLEASARHHHAIIAAIHEARVILPVRFGCVYASAEELLGAVTSARDSLADQLGRYEGCDEWAIHLHADAEVIRRRVLGEDADARRVQQELASAGPGRAYFLRRKLQEIVAAASQRAMQEGARELFDRLARLSVDGLVAPASRASGQGPTETEILRAAFLVRRDDRDVFLEEARSVTGGRLGLDCRSSGPWPPYSFASAVEART
jgi:hypothetical protein